jgi:hypothetical protein
MRSTYRTWRRVERENREQDQGRLCEEGRAAVMASKETVTAMQHSGRGLEGRNGIGWGDGEERAWKGLHT